jgi:predicted ATPase
MSGQPEFRPIYDALSRMGFYNFNPDVIRELQSPDVGEVLAGDGRNLASVLKRLSDDVSQTSLARIITLLSRVVPGISSVSHKPQGKKETLEFRQIVAGSKDTWRFDAENMSDGTLRALGVLAALFQSPPSDNQLVPLVGIEEPETALHPGAASVLRTALLEASRRTQVIVTSHSPDLLDDKAITEDMLLSVTSEQGTTRIGRVDHVSRDAIRDHLFTAGELLRLNQLGTSDFQDEIEPEVQSVFET